MPIHLAEGYTPGSVTRSYHNISSLVEDGGSAATVNDLVEPGQFADPKLIAGKLLDRNVSVDIEIPEASLDFYESARVTGVLACRAAVILKGEPVRQCQLLRNPELEAGGGLLLRTMLTWDIPGSEATDGGQASSRAIYTLGEQNAAELDSVFERCQELVVDMQQLQRNGLESDGLFNHALLSTEERVRYSQLAEEIDNIKNTSVVPICEFEPIVLPPSKLEIKTVDGFAVRETDNLRKNELRNQYSRHGQTILDTVQKQHPGAVMLSGSPYGYGNFASDELPVMFQWLNQAG